MQPIKWWDSLSDDWKKAFNEAVLNRAPVTDMPEPEQLQTILQLNVLRMAGPGALYPNMRTQLRDLSGLNQLKHLEILVVTHHQIRFVTELEHLERLKSLFIFDNQIESLDGIEKLSHLQELYCQNNYIPSLKPVSGLTELHTLYCATNQMESLEGVGQQHVSKLQKFYCLPNAKLKDTEVIRFEREVGIRCLRG